MCDCWCSSWEEDTKLGGTCQRSIWSVVLEGPDPTVGWPTLIQFTRWPFAIFRVGWQAHAPVCQGELCLPSPGFIHVPQLQKVSQVGHSLANTLRLTFGLAEEIVVGHVKYNILGWSKTTALFKKDLRCWTLEIEGYPMVREPLNLGQSKVAIESRPFIDGFLKHLPCLVHL